MSTAVNRETDRRDLILNASLAVFMRYGFTRVTMDDIAREAGISRPALYREFRNKADIYSALAGRMLTESCAAAEAVLEAPGDLEDRLMGALAAGILDPMTEISNSPHGAEILDQKERIIGDIVAASLARMTSAMADAIEDEARARGIDLADRGLSAGMLAMAIMDGLDGAKHRSTVPSEWRAAARGLVRLAMMALQA